MPRGDGTGPMGGGGPGTGKGGGRGQMGGNRPGSGPGGYCVCPACGEKITHQVDHLPGPHPVLLHGTENAAEAKHHGQRHRRQHKYPQQLAQYVSMQSKNHNSSPWRTAVQLNDCDLIREYYAKSSSVCNKILPSRPARFRPVSCFPVSVERQNACQNARLPVS